MEEQSLVTPPALSLRGTDKLVGIVVALICTVCWALVPAEWSPLHTGGKWFLGVFAVTSGVAAALASRFLSDRELQTKDQPAVWLGIQVLFWNPLAYRTVLGVVEAIGLSSTYSAAVAAATLLLLGLPTTLLGALFCRSPSWIATYAFRAAACFVTTWVPLLPGLVFLHVLVFAHLVTWSRYTPLHRVAVGLIVAEQLAAFLWVFLFGKFD